MYDYIRVFKVSYFPALSELLTVHCWAAKLELAT